jgi:hypothetical protein
MLRKTLIPLCAVALLSSLAIGTAAAQNNNWNQRTYFTFSAPVELPGKTLPAGTYLFRLMDSPSNRHVIQVFDKNEQQIFLTALAIPAQRIEAADQPEVRFMETPADRPAAIRTWWFPGRTVGHEFIYPKAQAMRLAARANDPVLTVGSDADTADEIRRADLARVNEQGQTSAVDPAQSTSSEMSGKAVTGRTSLETDAPSRTATTATARRTPPAGQEATTVPQSTGVTQRPVDTPPSTPATSTDSVRTQPERTELPQTATPLPLVAVLGLVSLAGAAAFRLRRR